jgi:hypothetical protein
MADFVAVLKKTLDGLNDPSPQMREKVYDKARQTIAGKLAAMNPPPADGVVERQKRALEEAIVQIEKEFAPPPPPPQNDPLAELENVFASLKSPDPLAALREPARPAPVAPAPEAAAPAVVPPPEPKPAPAPAAAPAPVEPVLRDEPPATVVPAPAEDIEEVGIAEPGEARPSRMRLVAAAVAVVAVAAVGYGAWANRDAIGSLVASGEPETPAPEAAAPAPEEPAESTETEVAAAPPAETPPEAAPAAPAAPAPAEAPGTVKFTQRLNSDGTEVDDGPAGGPTIIGEGTSVAAVTQPPPGAEAPAITPPAPAPDATAAPDDATSVTGAAEGTDGPEDAVEDPETAAAEPAAPAPAAAPEQPAGVPVGQRAIFYEERTNVADASAEPGAIVWSLVQESPGGDLPPEPAIRAEATIPGKEMQLRMTIRRNADRTLPASHIVEMIFLTPDGFEGGGIQNVLRLSFKNSEQEAGSPLLGIPAKIADGFFLIALNDTPQEIQSNISLMQRLSWIDVPIQYTSGRRALFTMEKGIPGNKVFEEALKAWQEASG